MTKEKLDIGRRVYERKQTAKEAAEENGVTLQTVDKGNIIFNNLGKITFTSFGYSSLNSSSFPFIL